MPQKLNIFNLGEKGVVLSRSPLHREDGSLVKAQNAEISLDEAEGGLKKRGGMPRLNSSSLSGSVQALVGVPLVDRSFGVGTTQTLYAAIDDGTSNNWRTSTDGSSFESLLVSCDRLVAVLNSTAHDPQDGSAPARRGDRMRPADRKHPGRIRFLRAA